MKTILIFAGTRPEIIKMAPLIKELRRRETSMGTFKPHFCFTGQHLEIALPFLNYFEIQPDSQLELLSHGQSLGMLTARAFEQIDGFLKSRKNTVASLVQGDTTTALVAALSSFYHQIPVGHVEAGLRTSSIGEPFPEELNRRIISQIATWHFTPTASTKATLLNEKIKPEQVFLTGNTGIDALLWAAQKEEIPKDDFKKFFGKKTVLITLHRRENLGEKMESILRAISALAEKFQDVFFILPVHPNPTVGEKIKKHLSKIKNIFLTDPLSYGDLVWTMKNSVLIMTDSGGIQEEAPSLSKPVLVLRDETERPEAVEYGTSFICGSHLEKIVSMASEFIAGSRSLSRDLGTNPFGDGQAAKRVTDHLLSALNFK